VERCLGEFNAQGLANTVWAFATVALLDALLFAVLARANLRDELLFVALARAVELGWGEINAQGLANTAWAFATADLLDQLLFKELARVSEQRLGEFSA